MQSIWWLSPVAIPSDLAIALPSQEGFIRLKIQQWTNPLLKILMGFVPHTIQLTPQCWTSEVLTDLTISTMLVSWTDEGFSHWIKTYSHFTDPRTRGIVKSFAVDQDLFYEKFVYAMTKMGQLHVLTGSQGEIRANCSVSNSENVSFLLSLSRLSPQSNKLQLKSSSHL